MAPENPSINKMDQCGGPQCGVEAGGGAGGGTTSRFQFHEDTPQNYKTKRKSSHFLFSIHYI